MKSKSRNLIRRKKLSKEARFEPYEAYEIINVPYDRHKLDRKQLKEANNHWRGRRSCELCGSMFNDKNKAHIDHCHVTGVIRGKICHKCNMALGLIGDSLYTVRRMVEYLIRFKYNPDMVEPDIWNSEHDRD